MDCLELGDVVEEGSFGVVYDGMHMDKELAVKRARGSVLSKQILESLSYVCRTL